MHSCVNPACYRWGTSLTEFVHVSRAAGFTAVEVSIQQAAALAAALAAELGGLTALTAWRERAGATVEQFSGIVPAGPVLPAGLLIDQEAFTATLPGLTHRLDVAAALGCRRAAVVVNPSSDLPPDQAREVALARLDLLAERASRYGITLAVEFIAVADPGADLRGAHPFITGPAALGALLDDLGRPADQVGVLLDVCHLYAAGATVAGQRSLHGRIAFVQACDIPTGTPPRAMSDALRCLPGTGIVDYPQLLVDLAAAGYDGPLSIELFSPSLWELDPPAAAAALFAGTRALLPAPATTHANAATDGSLR